MTAKEIRRLGTNEVEEAVRLVMEVFAHMLPLTWTRRGSTSS